MTSPRILRVLVAFATVALIGAGCGNGDEVADEPSSPSPEAAPGEPELLEGELHACAADLPVPDGVSILQSGQAPAGDGSDTCIATLSSTATVDAATGSYRTAFDDAGWTHATEQEEEQGNVLRFTDPHCGFLVVVSGQTAAEMGLVSPEQTQGDATVILAQFLSCDQMPPPQDQEQSE